MMACECRTAECCVMPTVKLVCPAGVVHTAQTHNLRVTAANHLDESLLCAAGLLLLHKTTCFHAAHAPAPMVAVCLPERVHS
jgi:hypothetical protein